MREAITSNPMRFEAVPRLSEALRGTFRGTQMILSESALRWHSPGMK